MKLDFMMEFIFMKFSSKQPSSLAKFMIWAAHTHNDEDSQLVILTHLLYSWSWNSQLVNFAHTHDHESHFRDRQSLRV